MKHLYNKIDQYWVQDDPDLTAKQVLADPEVIANWDEWLFPLLRNECRRLARADTRRIEDGSDQPILGPQSKDDAVDRCPLLDQRFCFGRDGEQVVKWGRATEEQHEQRNAMQARFQATIAADIDHHRKAIEDIQGAGVTCLDEIPRMVAVMVEGTDMNSPGAKYLPTSISCAPPGASKDPTSNVFASPGASRSATSNQCPPPGATVSPTSKNPASPGAKPGATSNVPSSPGARVGPTSNQCPPPGATPAPTSSACAPPGTIRPPTSRALTSPGAKTRATSKGKTPPGAMVEATSTTPPPPGASGPSSSMSAPLPGDWRALRVWAEVFADLQQTRIATVNRIERGQVDPMAFEAFIDSVTHAEQLCARTMRAVYRKTVPATIVDWQKATIGIGDHQLARLLGHLGHPVWTTPHSWETTAPADHVCEHCCRSGRHLVAGEPFRRTLHQLWQYCGVGESGRPRKGMSAAELARLGAPRCKMLLRLMAESCMKQAASPFRVTYDKAKFACADRVHAVDCVQCGTRGHPALVGTPWRKGHQHGHALRVTAKEILRDLWIVAGGRQ